MFRLKTTLFLKVKNIYMFRLWVRSGLRHCATSRKVTGSIPDGVIILILPAALGSTQPLTDMSAKGMSCG